MGVVQETVDGGVGDRFGHQLVEAGRVQVRRQRDGAFLVGGIDNAVERFGGLCRDWEQSDVVDLCRCRHRLTYAEPGTMPSMIEGIVGERGLFVLSGAVWSA